MKLREQSCLLEVLPPTQTESSKLYQLAANLQGSVVRLHARATELMFWSVLFQYTHWLRLFWSHHTFTFGVCLPRFCLFHFPSCSHGAAFLRRLAHHITNCPFCTYSSNVTALLQFSWNDQQYRIFFGANKSMLMQAYDRSESEASTKLIALLQCNSTFDPVDPGLARAFAEHIEVMNWNLLRHCFFPLRAHFLCISELSFTFRHRVLEQQDLQSHPCSRLLVLTLGLSEHCLRQAIFITTLTLWVRAP
jgi:hypothetical protein